MFKQNNISYAAGHSPFWKQPEGNGLFSNFDSPCDGISDPVKKEACIKAQDQRLLLEAQGGTRFNNLITQNQQGMEGVLSLGGGIIDIFGKYQAAKTGQVQPQQNGVSQAELDAMRQAAYAQGLAEANTGGGGTTPDPKTDPAPQSEEDKKQQQFILFGGIGVGVLVLVVVVLMVTGKKK